MKFFFSCDWGTSTFRLRLIAAEDTSILAEIKTSQGIATTHQLWKEAGGKEEERVAFYRAYLFEQLKKMKFPGVDDLSKIPVVLSGMASSGIGMYELPYKQLPFHTDGSDLLTRVISSTDIGFPAQLIFISGVCSSSDVMRGEETILAGCEIPLSDNEALLIFPGTHSKHVLVRNGLVHSVATYMTGELFNLLAQKSILANAVQTNGSPENIQADAFAEGVMKGLSSNFLNSIFQARVNYLLNKASNEQNYFYLSGLLIGHELKDLAAAKPISVTLVGSGELQKLYQLAISILGLDNRLRCRDADKALISGQQKIVEQQGYSYS